MTLNQEQTEVVRSPAQKLICIASPGSGKSRVLCERILQNISDGADPSKIIAFSYTNAAADIMQQRLGDIKLGACSTLHSFLLKLIGEHHALVNLPETISVFDDDQTESLLETIMAEMGVKVPVSQVMLLLKMAAMINPKNGMSRSKQELVAIEFNRRLRQGGLLSFDSILFYGHQIILQLGFSGRWKYTHVFGDEWQDAAEMDCLILEVMPCENFMVTGDPDQSIYRFRGSCDWFEQTAKAAPYNGWQISKLETNYRSGHIICGAANRLIQNNLNRFNKSTIANTEGGEIRVTPCNTEAEELAFVLDNVSRQIKDGCEVQEISVLARTNKIAKAFSEHLMARGIPVAHRKFSETPADWKKAKLLLTLMANVWNDLAAYQYLVEKHGQQQADEIKLGAAKAMQSIHDYHFKFSIQSTLPTLSTEGISAESRELIHDAARTLSGSGEWSVNELILFLNNGELQRETVGEGVFIGTAHAAKGREFRCVHVVGFEEGLFPTNRKDSDIQECRRLAYVAITRAKEKLFISYCKTRPKPFAHVMETRQPSRFIFEMGLIGDGGLSNKLNIKQNYDTSA